MDYGDLITAVGIVILIGFFILAFYVLSIVLVPVFGMAILVIAVYALLQEEKRS